MSVTHYAFWQTASPSDALARLAFYRDQPRGPERVAYLATAGPFVTVGQSDGVDVISTVARRYCPYDIDPPIVIADPHARECRAFLRGLLAPAHHRGSWYRREPLEPLLHAIETTPAPVAPPNVPELPARLLHYVPETPYKETLLRAEALAYLRGLA